MTTEELKNKIIERAYELGFNECRFAAYRKMTSEAEIYKEWIGKNYNAEMGWMERNIEKREDIAHILPGVKTVITLAHSYFTENNPTTDENSGKIARYAWGSDYHKVIAKKLKSLVQFIGTHADNTHNLYYTDTGPIMERQWAVDSGIGWQAKNSLVINRKLGSYFFISVIVSDIEFPTDNPFLKDYCGKCTKCIDACPTDAIIKDRTVDANKCISFWTIESKSEIPENIQANLNNWIFGCDICQEVCPWNNARLKPTIEELFYPRNGEKSLSIEEIKTMEIDEFNIRFANSPVKRTKLEGLKRNALAIAQVK